MRGELKGLNRNKPLMGLGWLFFILYSLFMIYLLFVGFSRSTRTAERMYNLVPLRTISSYIVNFHHYNLDTWVINLFGNVAAFVPFGFLIPWLFRKVVGWGQITCLFFVLLLGIESLQYVLNVGSFDVDDILLNVIGGLLGFLLFKVSRICLH